MKKILIINLIFFSLFLFGCTDLVATDIPARIDCDVAPIDRPISQLSYLGVYAGKTSDNEVDQLLGPPLSEDVGDTYKTLTYPDAYIHIKDKVVLDVFVFNKIPNMSWFIDNYGCPDTVIHFELHPESGESSNYVSFVYFKAGVTLTNYRASQIGIPFLQLEDSPTNLSYTEPFSSLEDYLTVYGYDLSSSVVSIVGLEDAIK